MGWNNVDMTPNRVQNKERFELVNLALNEFGTFFQERSSVLNAARSNAASLLSQVRSRYPAGSEAENQLNSSIAALERCQNLLPELQAHLGEVSSECAKFFIQYGRPRNEREGKLSRNRLVQLSEIEVGKVLTNKALFEPMVTAALNSLSRAQSSVRNGEHRETFR